MEPIIYGTQGSEDSEVMREFLSSFGLHPQLRLVDSDSVARQEWEDLDGRVTPLVVIPQAGVVRGLDCTRAEQLLGWIGC